MATNTTYERGWQIGKSLADSLQYMLENEVACDVTFEVRFSGNPQVKVSAHKMILQARSPVFEAMFSGAFVESGQNNIIITDVEPDIFKTMLKYLYTDDVTLTGDNVLHLRYAANKYILEDLSQKCKDFLAEEISMDNACTILTHSLVYQDEDLVNTSLDLIAPNVEVMSKTEAFYNMSQDALLKVVRYDKLASGVETELFEGCLEWGRRKVRDPTQPTDEEIRELLGECLHQIRFPHMSLKDFASKFGRTTVLIEKEKNLIYALLATNDESYSVDLASLGFDVSPRVVTMPPMRCQRYSKSYGEHYQCHNGGQTEECFTFSASKRIQLVGFSVYGGASSTEHDVTVNLQSLPDKQINYSTKCKITPTGDDKPIPVYVKNFQIQADSKFRVTVVVTGKTKTGYGGEVKQSETVEGVVFSMTDNKFPAFPISGTYKGGYVAEILFQRLPG